MAYTRLSYIQSTGIQYIDTGYYPNNKTKVEISFNIGDQDGYTFGARNSSLYYDFSFCKEGNTLCFYYSNNYTGDIYASYPENHDIIAECEVNKTIINGVEYTDTTVIEDYDCTYTMYIFCTNKRDTVYKIASMIFYYMKIWDNGSLVRDYIPVLDENNVACLYDKVSGTYYYNAGTGDFIAGDPITPPTITVGTPTKTKISRVEGYDQSVVTFISDMDLQAWEARATLPGVTPARGVGLLVESGTTLSANAEATIYVDDEELTNGDNEYTITVYGQSMEGEWSE